MAPMRKSAVVGAIAVVLLSAQPAGPETQARRFLELLSRNDAAGAAALLDAGMKARLPLEKLQQVWGGLVAQAGAFKQFGEARTEAGDTADTVVITCEFEKLKLDARIPVTKTGLVSGLNIGLHIEYTPPAYVNASSFREREVVVGKGEWALHGTVTIPNGSGLFPALVLVHGSGSYDRDYTIGPNKLFRDIAWGVASRGVASIRYNKRSYEHAAQFANLTSYTVNEESIDDAVLAAELLRSMPEINPKKVFVLGHSLGATLAPRIGKADPTIAGLILAGGTAHFLLDVIVPQMIHNFTLNGPMSRANERAVEKMKQQVALAESADLKPDTAPKELPLGIAASYWLDLRAYHPTEAARELRMPMLILQGERDYQVTLDDWALWKKALGERKDVEFKLYPKLSHIFVEGEGPSFDAEYARPGHVAQAVVEDVAVFAKK